MENMFHTAYYVVKKEKPFTDFPDLVQLNSRTGSNMTNCYLSDKTCLRFTIDIYNVEREQLLSDLKNAGYIMFEKAGLDNWKEKWFSYALMVRLSIWGRGMVSAAIFALAIPLLSKGTGELRMLADAMEEKVLKPTNLKGARWLPYIHKATQILCNSYAIFVAHSEDQVSPERSAQRGHPDLHLQ
ncbi:hypothetical protein F7725_000141 [Dissostichus mawsoni]|uniref:Uncharacterized protein n=1 Tax=Dissostichus mawsoni TaxID=36200 RepID=A0A7J5ZE35_DISMA|nr:hypothetical protein F7725_000141 [Dissostichus mawsoni]